MSHFRLEASSLGGADLQVLSDQLVTIQGVEKVEHSRESGPSSILLEMASVLVVTAAANYLVLTISETVIQIRNRFRRPQVIDLTGDEPKVFVLEAEGMRGDILVKTRDGHQFELLDDSNKESLVDILKQIVATD